MRIDAFAPESNAVEADARAGAGNEPEISEDVVYAEVDGRRLRADVFRPPPGTSLRAAVIQLHGGGLRTGDRKRLRPRSEQLSRLGFTCVAAEYRLITESRFPAQVEDVGRAIRWVRSHAEALAVDPERIVLQGYSAGGQLALLAAGSRPPEQVAAVMALYAPADFYIDAGAPPPADWKAVDLARTVADARPDGSLPAWRIFGPGATAQDARLASPLSHLGPGFPPTLLVHGTADTVVKPAASERLHRALRDRGVACDLHLMAGFEHNFDEAPSVMDVVQREAALFFRRVLDGPSLAEEQRRHNPLAGPLWGLKDA